MMKYFAVSKAYFQAQLVYRFDVIMTAVATFGRVVCAWILWGAIFQGKSEVGGFTIEAMLFYYLVASFLSSIDISSGVSGEVMGRIRNGTFSKFMVIPSNPLAYFTAMDLGAAGYYAMFSLCAAVFSAVVFGISPGIPPSPASIICAILMIPLGLVFMVEYHYFVGILTFKFGDMGFFWHIQGSLLQFLTGAIVPLSLLPVAILTTMRFLPFTYVTYAPAMLLTGRMDASEGVFGLITLGAWALIALIACELTYNRLRVKYDGVGI